MTVEDFFSGLLRNAILPPGLLFVVILAGLAIRLRWRRGGNWLAGFGLVLLYTSCTAIGSRLLVEPLEAMTTPLAEPGRAGAQANVGQAAGREPAAPEYGDQGIPDYIALARLRYAARLHRQTGLPVLVTGGNRIERDSPSKAEEMAIALREDFDIPVRWVEGESETTQQNAKFSARLLQQDGFKRVLLVTDAMHMRRSVEVFAYYGLEPVAAPTLFFSRGELDALAWLPGPEGLRRTWYATYEWIGLIWYRLHMRGYIDH
jgi:uncharacterized SAM-binding protein YcdF (DUF218 family)